MGGTCRKELSWMEREVGEAGVGGEGRDVVLTQRPGRNLECPEWHRSQGSLG